MRALDKAAEDERHRIRRLKNADRLSGRSQPALRALCTLEGIARPLKAELNAARDLDKSEVHAARKLLLRL